MNDKSYDRQQIIVACNSYVTSIRGVLSSPGPGRLNDLLVAGRDFRSIAAVASTDSFVSISRCIDSFISGALESKKELNQLELETMELAADWLGQLVLLYRERLPEPKSLIEELLYTFELVERSHDAASLSELLSTQGGVGLSADMFAQDPEFVADNYNGPQQNDPFDGDPAFGMEFDRLQRPLTLEENPNKVNVDIFSDDERFDVTNIDNESGSADIPFDVFEDDPAPED